MRQLATTAANEGTTNFGTTISLQNQIRKAVEGIDRVSQFTRFGNKNLLDGSQGTLGTGDNEELVFLRASEKSRPYVGVTKLLVCAVRYALPAKFRLTG